MFFLHVLSYLRANFERLKYENKCRWKITETIDRDFQSSTLEPVRLRPVSKYVRKPNRNDQQLKNDSSNWRSYKRRNKKERCLQDLNLRGETPLDFKSNALTTRPKQLANLADFIKYESNFVTQLIFFTFIFNDIMV